MWIKGHSTQISFHRKFFFCVSVPLWHSNWALVCYLVRMHVDKTLSVSKTANSSPRKTICHFVHSILRRACRKPLLREGYNRTILMYLTRQKYSICARAFDSAEVPVFFLIDADEFVGIGKTLKKKTVLVSTDERRSLLTTPLVLVSFNSQIYNWIWPGL